MPLTAEQLTDLRADLGDTGASPAFSDAELERLYVRAGENYAKTMVMALNQLLASVSKLTDYTQNQTQEKASQVFGHLSKLRDIWQAQASGSSTGMKVVRVGIAKQRKDEPYA